MVKVTVKLLEAGRSSRGGWGTEQLKLLGVKWPPQKGWKKLVLGMEVSEEDAEKFVELKDEHL